MYYQVSFLVVLFFFYPLFSLDDHNIHLNIPSIRYGEVLIRNGEIPGPKLLRSLNSHQMDNITLPLKIKVIEILFYHTTRFSCKDFS